MFRQYLHPCTSTPPLGLSHSMSRQTVLGEFPEMGLIVSGIPSNSYSMECVGSVIHTFKYR